MSNLVGIDCEIRWGKIFKERENYNLGVQSSIQTEGVGKDFLNLV